MTKKSRRIPCILPGEREARRECYPNHKDSFDLNDDLLKAAVRITSVDYVTLEDLSEEAATVLLGLYAKACKTFRAIQVLCLFGLEEDANGLLRVLAETLINMFYMDSDSRELREKRAQKFLDHGIIWMNKYLDIAGRHQRFSAGIPHPRKGAMAEIVGTIRKKYGEKEFRRMSKSHRWNGLSVEAMSRKVKDADLRLLYDVSMRSSSASLHGGDIPEHIGRDRKGRLILKIMPGDRVLQGVLWVSNALFLGILEKINQLFQLGRDQELKDFGDRPQAIQHAVAGPLPPSTASI